MEESLKRSSSARAHGFNGVPGEVVEVVHDHSHKKVEHEETAKEDEGDEVGVGEVGATRLFRIQYLHKHSNLMIIMTNKIKSYQ